MFKNLRAATLGLLLGLLALPIGLPMLAQDESTPEPEATPIVVSDDTTINVEPGGTVNIDAPESSVLPTLLNLVLVVVGAVIGGGSFALIWSRIRTSKEAKDSIERLAEGLSPTWQASILRILDIAEQANKTAAEVLLFAREVTDGLPNTAAPAESHVRETAAAWQVTATPSAQSEPRQDSNG